MYNDHVLLHWHQKVKAWLPPGGHVDENEDPVQAVLREIEEESGIIAEIVPTSPDLTLDYPTQVAPPFTIMVEDIDDPIQGFHQHIDMIYFCRPVSDARLHEGWLWVSRRAIEDSSPLKLGDASAVPPPEDVRVLAVHAFDTISGDGN